MCWNGEPGIKGYVMSEKDALFNMARLSLTGKLSIAILKSIPWYNMVPYYEWNPKMKKEELINHIIVPTPASRYVTLVERVLSILLKRLEKFD